MNRLNPGPAVVILTSRAQFIIGAAALAIAACGPLVGLFIQVNTISERQQAMMARLDKIEANETTTTAILVEHTAVDAQDRLEIARIQTILCLKKMDDCPQGAH